MTAIDSTDLQALENFADRVHQSGRHLIILCGAREWPAKRIQESEFHDHVGIENICGSVAEALDRAKSVYSGASKQHPARTTRGRINTGVPLLKTISPAPASSTAREERQSK